MHEFLKVLKKDHDEVKGLLKQFEQKKKGSAKERQEIFKKIKEEILPHSEAEEKAFYSVLKQQDGNVKEHTLAGYEEHRLAEQVLKELDKLSPDEDKWNPKMKVLKDLLEHHIEEEESEIFKDAQKVLDDSKLSEILQKFNEEKEKEKKKL